MQSGDRDAIRLFLVPVIAASSTERVVLPYYTHSSSFFVLSLARRDTEVNLLLGKGIVGKRQSRILRAILICSGFFFFYSFVRTALTEEKNNFTADGRDVNFLSF